MRIMTLDFKRIPISVAVGVLFLAVQILKAIMGNYFFADLVVGIIQSAVLAIAIYVLYPFAARYLKKQ